MEIYLIRHGQINRNGTCEDYFYKLNDDGNLAAKNASLFVNRAVFDKSLNNILLSSNTIRTIQTYHYILVMLYNLK